MFAKAHSLTFGKSLLLPSSTYLAPPPTDGIYRVKEVMMSDEYVSLAEVLDFVERTIARRVPVRVALTRASRHFGVPRAWVVSAYRSQVYEASV